ncbi:MAG: Ldh family oxidoreductase [Candidatus Cloacimonetes bacterium]|mgnify:FL=1|jgi:LDH2 family malate/lactate/ureidoglycolate dehydrogenase|nr:Ldh family oxidoreductase [Candidatus Cloacimonadota bacterium]
MSETKRIPVEKIYNLMVEVFTKLGVPNDEAKVCADVLIESDLRGIESHGVGRLKMYYDRIKAGIQFASTNIDVIKDFAAVAVWDGNHGMGHVISKLAMQSAIDKAKEFGIGCVTVRNSTHYGICGYYAKMACEQNMVGITMTNARPSIAPLFGVSPMLGTNPICFGAPSDKEYDFIYDAATSISQRGKVEVYGRAEKPTPEGWAIDEEGKTYTDTKQLLKDLVDGKASMIGLGGMEEESGGHKGYSLAVMVEILSAALQAGSFMHQLHGWEDGKRVPYKLGHIFLAMDIEKFTDIDDFKRITGEIMVQLQNSKKRPDKDRIWIAGEKEHYTEMEIREKGIVVNPGLQKNLVTMINELNLDNYNNLF